MVNLKEILTPAKLRRLTEPIIKLLAEIDRDLHIGDALVSVVYDLYGEALRAGVARATLLAIAKESAGMDIVLKSAPTPIDYRFNSDIRPNLALFRRHVSAYTEALSRISELENRTEGLTSLVFEMAKSARLHGVPDTLLDDVISGVNQPHHEYNLDPTNMDDIKKQTDAMRSNAL